MPKVLLLCSSIAVLGSATRGDDTSDTLSLMQLRSAYSFGCSGEASSTNLLTCGFWGDPHRHCTFGAGCESTESAQEVFDSRGWHWLARSKDHTFSLQAFFRPHQQPPAMDRPASIIALAGQFGSTKFQMIKKDLDGVWWETWSINGTAVDMSDLPKFFSDGMYMRKHTERIYSNKKTEEDPAGACIEDPGHTVAIKAAAYQWQGGYTGSPIGVALEMDSEAADLEFGICNSAYHADNLDEAMVDPGDIIVSPEDHSALCELSGYTADECVTPLPSGPAKPVGAKEMCEQTGLSFQDAQTACRSQGPLGFDMFQACLYDACASTSQETEDNAAGGASGFDETINPQPICCISSAPCDHCDACTKAESVDLGNVVQSNLGGLGPDVGAEEVRYARALTINSVSLDIVLTASNYSSPEPFNGVSGDFGKLGLAVGTESDMNFKFVDSSSQSPVNLSTKIALTIYDIDQSKYGAQESIKVCGAAQAYISSNSELENSTAGNCLTYASTQHGIGRDNPRHAANVSSAQMDRSVTFMFESVSSIDVTFAVGHKTGGGPGSQRWVLFSFAPAVACGTLESAEGVTCDKS